MQTLLGVKPFVNTVQKGRNAEDLAVNWLEQNSYKIIKRNFRKRGFEIDIIAIDKEGVLRFVEVKNVVEGELNNAVFSIKHRNIKNYTYGINVFLAKHPEFKNTAFAIDAFILDNGTIRLYPNISSVF